MMLVRLKIGRGAVHDSLWLPRPALLLADTRPLGLYHACVTMVVTQGNTEHNTYYTNLVCLRMTANGYLLFATPCFEPSVIMILPHCIAQSLFP